MRLPSPFPSARNGFRRTKARILRSRLPLRGPGPAQVPRIDANLAQRAAFDSPANGVHRLAVRDPRRLLCAHKQIRLRKGLTDGMVCLLLVAAVFAVFGQTVGYAFVNLDDDVNVYENHHVMGGLTAANVVWAFSHCDAGEYWHPISLISLMAEAEIVGSNDNPASLAHLASLMHLINVVLHAANAIVLYAFLCAATGKVWPGAMVAAIFAAHPLHVESVAWVSERKDVLRALFGLLAAELCVVRLLAKLGSVAVGSSHAGPRSHVQADTYNLAVSAFAIGFLAPRKD